MATRAGKLLRGDFKGAVEGGVGDIVQEGFSGAKEGVSNAAYWAGGKIAPNRRAAKLADEQIRQNLENSPQYGGSQELQQVYELYKNAPQYELPSELQMAANNYRTEMSRPEMFGQDILERKLEGSTARAMRDISQTTTGGGGSLGAIANIYGQQQDALSDIAFQGSQRRDTMLDKYNQSLMAVANAKNLGQEYNLNLKQLQGGALSNIAQDKLQQFQINEMMPYQNTLDYLTASKNAAIAKQQANKQSWMNLLSGVIGAGASVAGAAIGSGGFGGGASTVGTSGGAASGGIGGGATI